MRLQGRELERALMLKETMNAGGGLTVSPETQARIHEREAQARQAGAPGAPSHGIERVEAPGAGGVVSPGHRPAPPPWLLALTEKAALKALHRRQWRSSPYKRRAAEARA